MCINTATLCDRFVLCRLCEFRQPDVVPRSDPIDERLPDRHETTEGAAEERQERQQALLAPGTCACVHVLSVCMHVRMLSCITLAAGKIRASHQGWLFLKTIMSKIL